jgi:hypothetical protein
VEQGIAESYEQFLRFFLTSRLGVILKRIPPGASRQYVAGKNELSAAMSKTPDGKNMLLAFPPSALH